MVGGDSLYEMQLNYGQKSTLSSCCIKMKLVTGRWLFVMPNCSCKCHLSLLSLCRFRSALYVSRLQPVEQDRLKGLNQYSSPTTRCPPLHPCAAALVTALWKVPGRENQQGFQSSRVETKVKKKKPGTRKNTAAISVVNIEQGGIIVWPRAPHFPLMCPWLSEHY